MNGPMAQMAQITCSHIARTSRIHPLWWRSGGTRSLEQCLPAAQGAPLLPHEWQGPESEWLATPYHALQLQIPEHGLINACIHTP